ncbi:MAG: hypothetical protein JW708_08435 [Vallitaleaceae bacterium]|nr:hypothetical protein [Vallitaleaceae bacterium]
MSMKMFLPLTILTLLLGSYSYEILYSSILLNEFIEEPVQVNFDEPLFLTIDGKDQEVELELLASYDLHAIVKSVNYFEEDLAAQISPIDLALAWGDINNPSIDKYVEYSQKDRWYFFSVNVKAPVPIEYVDYYSANTHLVPANLQVKEVLMNVDEEDYIHLTGYLINAYFENGYWKTSLLRSDTGDGSCEIMYVTHVSLTKAATPPKSLLD